MLQQILEYIHNYFIKTPYPGQYAIADGILAPQQSTATQMPALKEGQRFWLEGSDLNDGVYTWHESGIMDDDDNEAAGLQAETFAGTICALAVPPAVLALAGEINSWVDTNSDMLDSPYQSESFNGYSYTLKNAGSSTGADASDYDWRNHFKKRLERWRKPCL